MPYPYTSDDDRWAAVAARDRAADGAFCYAVRSTRVYCRPSCPSRRPRRGNVQFFATPAAAEAAGFRACRRCEPASATADERAVARVQRLLEAAERPPTLQALAAAAGYSPAHLQRLFKRATGLSPRQYGAALRVERLKAGLRGGASVTEAMYQAGYGSSRALYESAPGLLGMAPRAYRRGGAGQTIRYACTETPLGWMLLAATGRGLCSVRFGDTEAGLAAGLRAEFPAADLVPDPEALAPYARSVRALLAGEAPAAPLPIDPVGTAFQQQVWAALRQIPIGQTRTYSQVAAALGRPAAVRAVAQACARNPLAVVTPCHRVVAAGGKLGGYRWGAARKQALLAAERAAASPGTPAPAG